MKKPIFKHSFSNSLLVGWSFAACLFSFPVHAQKESQEAGKVVIVSGKLTATLPNQTPRSLMRGAVFYVHDTLVTTASTKQAQLRFTDGTIVSLRPNTTFKVEDYHYQSASEKTSLMNYVVRLVKGGFRSVSGIIAKHNPNAYKIETPVATIGVRGTEFSLLLDKKGRLAAGASQGSIKIKNSGGCIIIGATASSKSGKRSYAKDQEGCVKVVLGTNVDYAVITSSLSTPRFSTSRPIELFNEPPILGEISGGTRNSSGTPNTGGSICIQ